MSLRDDFGEFLSPPAKRVDTPTESDWQAVERKLGFALPQDYKRFVEFYGTGSIDGFLWILNPISKNPNLNLFDQATSRLNAQRRFSEDLASAAPYALHPEANGLFPWAVTDNGDVLYWLCEGETSAWKIVICDGRCTRWQLFNAGVAELLKGIVTKEIRIECFPNDFPSQTPEFCSP